MGYEKPWYENANNGYSIKGYGQVEWVRNRQVSWLKEIRRIPHEGGAAQIWNCPGHTNNFCAPQVDSTEAIPVWSTGCESSVKGVDLHHHGSGMLHVILITGKVWSMVVLRRQPCPFSLTTTEIPEQGWFQLLGHRPHPLKSKRHVIRRLIRAFKQTSQKTGSNQLTDTRTNINICR